VFIFNVLIKLQSCILTQFTNAFVLMKFAIFAFHQLWCALKSFAIITFWSLFSLIFANFRSIVYNCFFFAFCAFSLYMLSSKISSEILLFTIIIACMSSLLTIFDLDVQINSLVFFVTNISTLTWVFWIFDLMHINDECEIVIFSSLIHNSCRITIFALIFANFMHACMICIDLAQLCCRIWIFNSFAKLLSFAIFWEFSDVILITISLIRWSFWVLIDWAVWYVSHIMLFAKCAFWQL